jgi:7-keto-8-aminopelargonate synthetase-like enzyme/acyl transferase domain-containing protein/acyl carrier protein
LAKEVSIAALNQPNQVVISGRTESVASLCAQLEHEGVKTTSLPVSHAFHSPLMEPMLDEFEGEVARKTLSEPHLPLISNLSGRLAGAEVTSADYWRRHAREAVRFAECLASARELGVDTFIEVGPHPVLSGMGSACPSGESCTWFPSLRRGHPDLAAILESLGGLHTQGVPIDCQALDDSSARYQVPMPTYAFQRERHWPSPSAQKSDLTSAGLSSTEHPLLGASLRLGDSADSFVFTNRISAADHPWLSDHKVFGNIVFPGTGWVELALAASHVVGAGSVSDLAILAPLVIDENVAVRLQVSVSAPDESGERSIAMFSCAEGQADDSPWVKHVSGVLVSEYSRPSEAFEELIPWPPVGASPVDLLGQYDKLEPRGLSYGPSFQGLLEAWQSGDTLYYRAALPNEVAETADAYNVHPALLDAALRFDNRQEPPVENQDPSNTVRLPFMWSNVSPYARGAREIRVRAKVWSQEVDGEGISSSFLIADAAGNPVASVGWLLARNASPEQIHATARTKATEMFRVGWRPASLPEQSLEISRQAVIGGTGELSRCLGLEHYADLNSLAVHADVSSLDRVLVDMTGDVPLDAVLQPSPETDGGAADSAHQSTWQAISWLKIFLADERFAGKELVWVTRGAVKVGEDDDVVNLNYSPLWGLVRSARSETSDRKLRLLDLDPKVVTVDVLRPVTGLEGEPDCAIRNGKALVPRLASADKMAGPGAARSLKPTGTVLVTGGTGDLGRTVARHLVAHRGVRHLVLTSRRGLEAPGAAELASALSELGAKTVAIVACDVADRSSLQSLLNTIAPESPLTAVYHLAGVGDKLPIADLTPEKLARVLLPKVVGAWNLHELTQGKELSEFVLFSSSSAVFGLRHGASYAAANSFLDALAAYRCKQGLVAQSLGWGLWEQEQSGLAAQLDSTDLPRLQKHGFGVMTVERGLQLLDIALEAEEAHLVLVRLNLSKFGDIAANESDVPNMFRGLVRLGVHSASNTQATTEEGTKPYEQIFRLSGAEREAAILRVIRESLATVFGFSSLEDVRPDQPFQELGLDSLMTVESANRLSAVLGYRVPNTLFYNSKNAAQAAKALVKIIGSADATNSSVAMTDWSQNLQQDQLASVQHHMRSSGPGMIVAKLGSWSPKDKSEVVKALWKIGYGLSVPTISKENGGGRTSMLDTSVSEYRDTLVWTANLYTGLNRDSTVRRHAQEAIDNYGTGMGTSPMVGGYTALHDEFERRFAEWTGKPTACLFSTGFTANLGLISGVLGPNDVIAIDQLCHASIIEGAKLSGAKIRLFKHNSIDSLREILLQETNPTHTVLVAFESVYSMGEGAAPVKDIVATAKEFDALVLVDEAHSMGIYGPKGAGLCAEINVSKDVDFVMATLSKSFASIGGVIATSEAFAKLMRSASGAYIYQATASPADVAAALASLERISTDDSLRQRIWDVARYMRNRMLEVGMSLISDNGVIFAPCFPDYRTLKRVEMGLLKRGILASCISYPVVEMNRGRIRFICTAAHTRDDVDRTMTALVETLNEIESVADAPQPHTNRTASSDALPDIASWTQSFLDKWNQKADAASRLLVPECAISLFALGAQEPIHVVFEKGRCRVSLDRPPAEIRCELHFESDQALGAFCEWNVTGLLESVIFEGCNLHGHVEPFIWLVARLIEFQPHQDM